MKEICVSTYCEWSSYGSVLQAMAFKNTLLDLGYDSFIVRDAPAPVSQKSFPFVFKKNPKALIKQLLNIRLKKKREALYEKSVEFINNNVDIKYYNDYKALDKHFPKADYYIAGSDQIWHPALCKQSFFLDFLPEGYKRLSYAASMGVTDIPKNKEEAFSSLILKFDTLSIRENEMEAVICKYTDKPISRHIDPTFLLPSDSWRSISREYLVKKPYVLVFAIYWDKQLNNELKKLHKKTGCGIVAVCPSGCSRVWATNKIYDADPGQFLYLIDHAEAVVSSSFHGVALSLNFNKKIAAVINPESPSRLTSLLDIFDLKTPAIADVMDFDLSLYESVNKKIEAEKQKSIQYLKEVLI